MNYWRDYCKDDNTEVTINDVLDDAAVKQRLPKCDICGERFVGINTSICPKCKNAILYARALMEDNEIKVSNK